MSQKGLVPIFVIFLTVTFLVAGYLVYTNYSNLSRVKLMDNRTEIDLQSKSSPVPSNINRESTASAEIANWKTYSSKEFDYEVQYPPDWDVVEAKPRVGMNPEWAGDILLEDQGEIQKVTFIEQDPGWYQGNFEIRVLSNPQHLTLEQWARDYKIPNAANPDSNLASLVGDTNLGGRSAKKFSIFTFEVPGETAIVAINKLNIYSLRFADWDKYNDDTLREQLSEYPFEKYRKIFNQILSTFRFDELTTSKFLDPEQ